VANVDMPMSNAIRRGDPVKQDKLIILILSGACTVVIGLMLLTFLFSPAISKSPGKRCVAISKGEYNGARRDKLLHARFGAYMEKGWFWRRSYWYCRY
jgi:hypothetical protein